MEEIIKLCAAAVAAAALIELLAQYERSYAILASVSICCAVLFYLFRTAAPMLEWVRQMSQLSGQEELACVLKAAGIAVLTQTAADICQDAGQKALAGRVILAGRLAVVTGALPLFSSLAETMSTSSLE